MKITGIIEAKAQNEGVGKTTGKPYIRYLFTINGKGYSTFDDKIFKEFNIGQSVEMEGEQDGAFFNMKTMKMAEGDAAEVVKVAQNGSKNGNGSMYASYAKDIFCALPIVDGATLKDQMQQAIDLVKQAKEAFE